MRAKGRRVHQVDANAASRRPARNGTFVPPTLIELDSMANCSAKCSARCCTWCATSAVRELDALLGQINGTGYGLTLGMHTRIDETIARSSAARTWATST
jgi:RHH-type proline utilization regulon transcriptional repressor/proline dehydrogenase/delta 1-pyrroline-5-carboxylate dehydrogenase